MTTEEAAAPVEGWALPTLSARKFHYFRGGRSLCGKWGWWGLISGPMTENTSWATVALGTGTSREAAFKKYKRRGERVAEARGVSVRTFTRSDESNTA